MDGKRDARSVESNSLKDHDVKEGDVFDDPRLDKLWNKVREEEEDWSVTLCFHWPELPVLQGCCLELR